MNRLNKTTTALAGAMMLTFCGTSLVFAQQTDPSTSQTGTQQGVSDQHNGQDQVPHGQPSNEMASMQQIRAAQMQLKQEGYSVQVTGQLDQQTRSAVRQFQTKHNISATGKLDSKTLKALDVNS